MPPAPASATSAAPVLPVPGGPVVPRAAKVDPAREYLAGGSNGYGYFTGAHVLSRAIDDVSRAFGPELYEFMLLDAAVAGAISKIRTGVLSGRVHLVPTQRAVPGRPKTPEMTAAEEVAENNRTNLARLDRPIEDVLGEMIYALAFGNKVAEVVEHPTLIDGKRALAKISPKPWWAWRFGVDAAGNVLGVLPTQGALGLAALGNAAAEAKGSATPVIDPDATILGIGPLLDPTHFAVLAWDARGGNPQGNSLLRPCYPWWNEKRQAIPEYRKFIRRMAMPKPVAEVGNPGTYVPVVDPVTLTELPGQQETNLLATLKLLQQWDNDSAVVLPGPTDAGAPGTKINWYTPTSDGSAFTTFYDFCDRMILRAVLQSARTVMEAQHGSKADSQTADDGEGSLYRFIGGWLARWLRRILFNLNVENYGPDAARLYTPEVMIGEAEHPDVPGLLTSFASVGYQVAPSQLPAMDAMVNLPERQAEEMQGPGDEGGDQPGEEPDDDEGDDGDDSSAPARKPAAFAQATPRPASKGHAGGLTGGHWITIGGGDDGGYRHIYIRGSKVLAGGGATPAHPKTIAQVAHEHHQGGGAGGKGAGHAGGGGAPHPHAAGPGAPPVPKGKPDHAAAKPKAAATPKESPKPPASTPAAPHHADRPAVAPATPAVLRKHAEPGDAGPGHSAGGGAYRADSRSVGNHFRIEATGPTADAYHAGFDAIHAVHRAPADWDTIPAQANARLSSTLGGYHHDSVRSHRVEVQPGTRHMAWTVVHEAGHRLDHTALGTEGYGFASEDGPAAGVMRAISATKTHKNLLRETRNSKDAKVRELADPKEVFARAYSQWVATRSRHPEVLAGLANDRRDAFPGSKGFSKQWPDAEFGPVATEFDRLFEARGLAHDGG